MPHRRILIIEDDKEIRESMMDILTDEGYHVEAAENGRMGLDILSSGSELPCLVLLDLMMPELDGKGFRQEQLKNPLIASIPTVLISADGQLDKKADLIGVSEFVRKPIDLTLLISLSKKYCG